jgi:ferric-dicitrate binding protein FerR (iron transport regulator)
MRAPVQVRTLEGSVKRQLAYQVCYVMAAVAACGAAARADGIATVTDVVNEGYRTPPGHEEQAARRADQLVQNEALRTDQESTIAVTFVDGSELSVEAESAVVLSDYVFDGAASRGLINLNDGLFHFTSHGKDDQGVMLRTPVATIGVRGTEFLVHVDGIDATVIDILSGAVEARPNGTGKPIICVGGQSILIAGPDADAQCGDLGSFSAAAGSRGPDRTPEPGHGGQNRDRTGTAHPHGPDRGGGDGGSEGGGDGGSGGPGGDDSGGDTEGGDSGGGIL